MPRTDSEMEKLLKTLDAETQLMNNHIVCEFRLDTDDLLVHITKKVTHMKRIVLRLQKVRTKHSKTLDGISLRITKLHAEVKTDSVGKLRYADTHTLNPSEYLKFYLTNVCPYVLDKISELNEIELELNKIYKKN